MQVLLEFAETGRRAGAGMVSLSDENFAALLQEQVPVRDIRTIAGHRQCFSQSQIPPPWWRQSRSLCLAQSCKALSGLSQLPVITRARVGTNVAIVCSGRSGFGYWRITRTAWPGYAVSGRSCTTSRNAGPASHLLVAGQIRAMMSRLPGWRAQYACVGLPGDSDNKQVTIVQRWSN